MFAASVRRSESSSTDLKSGNIRLELDDRPAPWILYAILAALGTFLIHNLIEFSLFEPAPLFLFCLLTGSALGLRTEGRRQTEDGAGLEKSPGRIVPIMGAALAGIAWLLAATVLAAPIVEAESLAHDADLDTADSLKAGDRRSLTKAADEMAEAFRVVPYNADYARRATDLLLFSGADGVGSKAKQLLDAAIAADPSSAVGFIRRAQFELPDPSRFDAALKDYYAALTLDPRNVRLRLDFARVLLNAATSQKRPRLAGDAAFEFDRAWTTTPNCRTKKPNASRQKN